jgi:cystathionine beta-synthase
VSSANQDALELVGNTPLVKLSRLDAGPCELFVKLENQNPGGSIKDRIALSMIEAAEQSGALKPGATVVEATAGNTGLGLAFVAVRKGYKLLLVMPDKMSREKISHLRALGADVRMTRSDVGKGHPAYYQDMAERLARELGGFYINQFENPANPLAHERTTAPEIWEQMQGKLDAVVVGVGSGGTITGLSRYFARTAPEVELVLGDPAGSVLAEYVASGKLGQAGSWLVEGVGEDFVPKICDLSRVKQAFTISDEESFAAARDLLRHEGILAGSSSGLLVAAALRYCRKQSQPKRVVTFICDSGNKYLSKMFNDLWMREQGFLRDVGHGDLRDLVSRRANDGGLISVGPEETLLIAYQRMKLADVSQVPVLDGDKIVGMIDESDLLLAVHDDPQRFREPVKGMMTRNLVTVDPRATLDSLSPLFERGLVVILMSEGKFYGLITRMDVLNHLRRRLG